MKKTIVFVTCILIFTSSLFAASTLQELAPGLTAEEIASVRNHEVEIYASYKDDILHNAPVGKDITAQAEESLNVKKGFTLSLCTLLPYPEKWNGMTADQQLLEMANCSLRATTMSGITYISRRAGYKEKVLFEDATFLGSPNKKDRIPDPVYDELFDSKEFYVLQDDTSFGKNIYNVCYSVDGDTLTISFSNYDALGVMGVNVIAPGKVKIALSITPVEEGIYIYCYASVKDKNPTINILGYKVDIEESILNRVIAIKDWFAVQITK